MSTGTMPQFLKELLCYMYPRGIMVSELKPRLKGTAFGRRGEKSILEALEALKDLGFVKLYKRTPQGPGAKKSMWVRATPEAIKDREVKGCGSKATH